MKKWAICFAAVFLICLWTAKCTAEFAAKKTLENRAVQTSVPEETAGRETTVPETATPAETTAVFVTQPPETTRETTRPVTVCLTPEEEELLLKIGMAERGDTGCTTCIALVMRTVLNRVESSRFSSTVRGVIYAQDQFTPVAEGTFESVVPNDCCREALEWVKQGWDESQGALYYEWCEGESWHSRNLKLLFQHCDVRFYQ